MTSNDGRTSDMNFVTNSSTNAAARRSASPSLLVATMRIMSTTTDTNTITDGTNSSRIVTPTRTLRLTEVELQQQQQHLSSLVAGAVTTSSSTTTPTDRSFRLSLEALGNRPRSNPHSRTPRRYESPLNHDEFRRERNTQGTGNNNDTGVVQWSNSIPGGVGTISERSRMVQSPGRSNKQDLPSQRKVRRWDNDSFVNLADEIKSTSVKVATVLRLAAKDAHLYRSIYDPNEHKPSNDVTAFLYGSQMKPMRENFFEGNGGGESACTYNRNQQNQKATANSEQDCWNRIDQRLRRIIERACCNTDTPASKVTYQFERFIIGAFTMTSAQTTKSKGKNMKDSNDATKQAGQDDCWTNVLLECPTITERKDGKLSLQFVFPNDMGQNNSNDNSSSGGFYRLLLHAVAQYHGLQATSRTIRYTPKSLDIATRDDSVTTTTCKETSERSCDVRALIVTGVQFVNEAYPFRIQSYLSGINTPVTSNNQRNNNVTHQSPIKQYSMMEEDNDWVQVRM